MKRQESISTLSVNSVPDSRVFEFIGRLQAAKEWIEHVLDVQLFDEKKSSNFLLDFNKALQNGIVLCYLMSHLDSYSIPRIQENTDQIFKLKENVKFFLEACSDFGVPRHKIFQVPDLFENKSIVNVVECVVALAQTSEKKGFQPAIRQDVKVEPKNIKLSKEEMENLKFQLSRIKVGPDGKTRPKISAVVFRTRMQLVMGDKDLAKAEKGFTKLQALVRGMIARNAYHKRVRDQAYRDNVAKEILETEREYFKNLSTLVSVYMKPLKSSKKPILSDDEISSIFLNAETIQTLSKQLLAQIETRVAKWSPSQCLGDVFNQIITFLPDYSKFTLNFNTSSQAIQNLSKQKPKFAEFLETQKSTSEADRRDIHCFMIMPIQRIPRYNLLLSDLTKHTWANHRDYQALCEAVNKVKEVAQNINEKKREAENFAKLYEIESILVGFDGKLAAANRTFRRETTLIDSKKNEHALILFSDILLVGTRDKKILGKNKKKVGVSKLTVKCQLTVKVTDIELKEIKDNRHIGFELLVGGKSLHKFYTETIQERDSWLKEFQSAKSFEESKTELQNPKLTAEAKLQEQKKRGSLTSGVPSSHLSNSQQVKKVDADYFKNLLLKEEELEAQLKIEKSSGKMRLSASDHTLQVEQQLQAIKKELKELKIPANEYLIQAAKKEIQTSKRRSGGNFDAKTSVDKRPLSPEPKGAKKEIVTRPTSPEIRSEKPKIPEKPKKENSKSKNAPPSGQTQLSTPVKSESSQTVTSLVEVSEDGLPNNVEDLIEMRTFILKQLSDIQDLTGKKQMRKSKMGTAGKYNFAAKLAIKLQENLETVEDKITTLGGANKLKEPIQVKKAPPSAPKSAPPPVPKAPKPKDVFSTVKIRSQLAKPLPTPPKPLQSQIESQINEDWQECYTDDGYLYYYNTKTNETSWELPGSKVEDQPVSDWEEYLTEDGNPYYYNKKTGESSWQNPFFEIKYEFGNHGSIQNLWLQKK